MAMATLESPAAGPSKSPRRISNFDDTSDQDDLPEASTTTTTPFPTSAANGLANRVSKVAKGVNGKKRKGLHGKEAFSDEAKRARKAEAERLFNQRQELPFYQGRQEILEEIMRHDTTIIIGETGCGKSTQLPQLLRTHSIALDHYSAPSLSTGKKETRFTRGPSIAVTQPRRLPAIALANRVSSEMGVLMGGEVGYSVRFEDVTGPKTKVRYMTEGVLMRELANADRGQRQEGEEGLNLLLRYDIVIVDEAHERTLNTDFICGALKRIQRIRKKLVAEQAKEEAEWDSGSASALEDEDKDNADQGNAGGGKKARVTELKIVIMSATLDPAKFSRFFETGRDALLVKGRMYQVSTRHVVQPVDDFIEAAARNVMQLHLLPGASGDMLVFMPGSEEIETCCDLIRRASTELKDDAMKIQVLPLYASLPPTAQVKIFSEKPENTRRVIVATNIAETSITIPGVAFVIDSGYKKEKEYIFRTSGAIEHLAKKSISQAAAWQRTGRAGRERSGECFRLFTQKAFDQLEPFDAPEIQRCNLASAILQLVAMGLDPFEFEYIDSPGRDPIAAAFQTLAGLGALDSPASITPLGRNMLKYPLDPAHARILLASYDLGCPSEIIDILSLLNSGPIWIDRSADRESAAVSREKFLNRAGDHLTALNVFRAYVALKEQNAAQGKGQSEDKDNKSKRHQGTSLVKWARESHVNAKNLAQAVKIRDQLRELASKNGHDWRVSAGGESEPVQRSLLQGLFMNTAVVQADGTYRQTAGSLQVKIHPSSVLMSKKVPAIVYDELAITSSIYARNVSSFDQSWLGDVPWFKQAGVATAQPTSKTSSL